jgi:hypothetical protein
MKKRIVTICLMMLCIACTTTKQVESMPLFEILKQSEQGGADFQFYEIITDKKEFKMILNDPDLRKKVKQDDILKANFILLNMGQKSSGGYYFSVENIEETPENIIVTIQENASKGMVTSVMTNPMCILKINSKKNIIIK